MSINPRPFRWHEAMAVLGITVLASVAISPVIVQAREKANSPNSLTNAHMFGMSASLYSQDYNDDDDRPLGAHSPTHINHYAGGRTSGNGITYHGGPIITGTTNVYYIWYGNWAGNSATTILTDFMNNLGGSPYYNINTTYYNGSNVHVSNSVHLAGSTTDSYSQGTTLSDAAVGTIVSSAITSGRLPKDTNALYFVLTSSDVNESSGFCTSYCGWHTYGTISGSNIKYSVVGNPDRCPTACAAQTTGPNGNAGADGMASIIAHELEETVTDANLNAWYDSRGAENGDKCAWTFGTTYTTSNGAKANMKLGTRDFLIQQNWLNLNGGACKLQY